MIKESYIHIFTRIVLDRPQSNFKSHGNSVKSSFNNIGSFKQPLSPTVCIVPRWFCTAKAIYPLSRSDAKHPVYIKGVLLLNTPIFVLMSAFENIPPILFGICQEYTMRETILRNFSSPTVGHAHRISNAAWTTAVWSSHKGRRCICKRRQWLRNVPAINIETIQLSMVEVYQVTRVRSSPTGSSSL